MSLNTVINYRDELFEINQKEYGRSTRLVVLEEAFVHNISVLRDITSARIIAVVKENGYGTGLINEYHILKKQKIDMFAVADSADALALREEGAEEDILMMTPVYDMVELEDLISENVIITVESQKQFETLKHVRELTGITPRVHIKIDTGMGRYGFYYASIPDISEVSKVASIEGCFTHLAGGDNYKKSVDLQIKRFKAALSRLHEMNINPSLLHAANSRAVMTFGDLGFNGVRVGSALLGRCVSNEGLKNAVWLESKIYKITNKPKGATISYSSQVTLKKDSRLAIIKAGFGDGVGLRMETNNNSYKFLITDALRRIKNRNNSGLTIRVNGCSCPVIGKPGFSHLVVDVGDTNVNEGDTVRIFVNPLLINPNVERYVLRSLRPS